jgi:hypothetical protein
MVKANFYLMSTFFCLTTQRSGSLSSCITTRMYCVSCIVYILCIAYHESHIMYRVSCIAYRVLRIMYCVSCIVYCVLCILYFVLCIVYCVLSIVYCLSCIVYRVSWYVCRRKKSCSYIFFSLDVAKNVANRTNCYVFNYVSFCNIHFIDLIGINTSSR